MTERPEGIAPYPRPALTPSAQVVPGADDAAETRQHVLRLVVAEGPITARELAARLSLTAAGVRRHLTQLQEAGEIALLDVPEPDRGRGRPARHYVAAEGAHGHLDSQAAALALEALDYIGKVAGEQAVAEFARARLADFEERYADAVAAAGPDPRARVDALAAALAADGFAATTRPVGEIAAIQLCQGHCPVREVAAKYPELCDAELESFQRVLGIHVQRLATIASGAHACTTSIPAIPLPTPGPPATS